MQSPGKTTGHKFQIKQYVEYTVGCANSGFARLLSKNRPLSSCLHCLFEQAKAEDASSLVPWNEHSTDQHGDDLPAERVQSGSVEWDSRHRSTTIAAAEIIAGLQDRGELLHDLHDVYIGATARTERLTVLTANVDHFERIADVQVVDWNTF